jgi:AcrR family transcriptional regulator
MATTAGEHQAVRDHILDAAHRVIARDGLAEASTRAIADEAGVASGTLYNYFEDRLDLIARAMLRRARILSAPLHDLPSRAGSGTVRENLRRFARQLSELLDNLVPLFAAAFSDAELLDAIRQTMSAGHGSSGSSGPFAAHPIEAYLRAEQAIDRVAQDADCAAAASLVLSLCHERAFLDHFFGRAGRRKSIAREVGFIAGSISTGAAGAAPAVPQREG